ncbi:MAG: DUF748 domain-containing protein [bacterium]
MKKLSLVLFLLVITFLTSAFSIKDWSASIYNGIKGEAEKSFSALFNRQVTINSSGGIIVGKIDLFGVDIPGIGHASKVVLNYNVVKFLANKGDMLPALSKITVVDGVINVTRDRQGDWNFLSIIKQEKGPAAAPAFSGQIVFKNCRVLYQDESGFYGQPTSFTGTAEKFSGFVDLRKKTRIGFSASGLVPEKAKAHGFIEPDKGNYAINVVATELPLRKWGNYFIPLPNTEIKDGKADLSLKITPAKKGVVALAGKVILTDAVVYEQNLSGDLFFTYNDGQLGLTTKNLSIYDASVAAKASFDFFGSTPGLNLTADFSRIDLPKLAQAAPGIEGKASGRLKITGPMNNLSGTLTADLTRALAFGQPLENINSSFAIKNGDFLINSFKAFSKTAVFAASGRILSDLTLNLSSEASGLRLSGRGYLGKMAATLSSFQGNLNLKLTPEFLAAPLRNLTAKGKLVLTKGEIAEQTFDLAKGNISIGEGKIVLDETFIRAGNSMVLISGETGTDVPTKLTIAGKELNLDDIRILNSFLPRQFRNPTGIGTLEILATGQLPASLTASGKINFSSLQGNFLLQTKDLTTLFGSFEGSADLELLFPGKIVGGLAGLNLLLGGSLASPAVGVSLAINNFHYSDIYLDSLAGSLTYGDGMLTLLKPFTITNNGDRYQLWGSISSEGIDASLTVTKASLKSFYSLARKVQGEYNRQLVIITQDQVKDSSLVAPKIEVISPPENQGFIASSFLAKWAKLSAADKKSFNTTPAENVEGVFAGEASLSGPFNTLSGKIIGKVTKGSINMFAFDSFDLKAQLDNQKLTFEQAILNKDSGNITASGTYQFNNTIDLNVAASKMPLDILSLPFPGKTFKGAFNLNAGVKGKIEDPDFLLSADSRQAEIVGVKFSKIKLEVEKQGNRLNLQDISFVNDGISSEVRGNISLSSPGKLALGVRLNNNALGLLNLFTDEIKWLNGQAKLTLKATGTFNQPSFNGSLNLKETKIYVRGIASNIKNIEGAATLKDNKLEVSSLTGIWQGERTQNVQNFLGTAGIIDLSDLLSTPRRLALNLNFSPSRLFIAFPGLYNGTLNIDQLALQGPLTLDLNEGPTLRGKINLQDAVLTLQTSRPGDQKVFPLNFDLDLDLNKNTYAVMGDVNTLNLSNVMLNLEVAGQELKLAGNLAAPSLAGRVNFRRGTINIFNREFTLLSTEMQQRFFPYDPGSVTDNQAVFKGGEGAAGLMPDIDLTSSVNVENEEKDASGLIVKKNVVILARLKGTLFSRQEQEALKIGLLGYQEDKTRSPSQLTPSNYSEQELKVMLLPDFIKSLAGINNTEGQAGSNKVEANAIMADYLSSRMQTILFRGFEREAERRLGLESLTLEYNFGPKMREALGVNTPRGFEDSKPAWSVGFVKGFFDRLFLDVKYSQGLDQSVASSTNGTQLNYQLTFKLTPIWSIIYYAEPIMYNNYGALDAAGSQKITLRAGFSFW